MPKYNFWINVVFYYAVWLVAVFGRDDWAWLVFLLLMMHVAWVDHRLREIALMVVVAAIGLTVDSAIAFSGLYAFGRTMPVLPIPFFLIAIWLGFGGTLRHALAYFVFERPLLGVVFATAGGPAAYWAAQRAGAVEFPYGLVVTLALLAGAWAIMWGLFVLIAREIFPELAPAADATP